MFKCDDCGRFISYADLDSGRATRKLIYPDSAIRSLCGALIVLRGQEANYTDAWAISNKPGLAFVPYRRTSTFRPQRGGSY